jgi:hypothetical protein
MSSNSNVAGLKLPTQKAMLSGNPRDSAIQANTNTNQKTGSLSAAVGGSRRRKGGAIAAPQFQMQYSDQSGPGGSANDQAQQNSQISTQQSANSALDASATTKGGRRKRRSRKGGNPDWKWGCYSGGKKKTKKTKKTKSMRRRRTKRRR